MPDEASKSGASKSGGHDGEAARGELGVPDDPDDSAALRATEIVHKLKPIRPARMRCVVLAEYLTELSADDAVDALAALVRRAAQHADVDYRVALECLVAMLGDPELLVYGARATLYAAAKQRGHHAIRRLFFEASPGGSDDRGSSDANAERPVVPRGRPLTLGERKSLARSHRRDLLVHLIRDPHPDVIRILLSNPHLTESDVLSLASRRPAAGAALREIAIHPQWSTRYPVKRSLVRNPYTPLALAMRLATTLRPGDLRSIARDPQLAELLREHAAGLLESQ